MIKVLKLSFLYVSKVFGLFYISRYATRRALRIICYHGFALADEHKFRPALFISPETFERRLQFFRRHGVPVIGLEDALTLLKSGSLPNCATVITIDDGFYSTHRAASGLLKEFSLPATLYVTTYYSLKNTPIFRLVVQYMFWKTQKDLIDLSKLDGSLTGTFHIVDANERERAALNVIRFGEATGSEEQRLCLERRLGDLLGLDFEQIFKTRILSLVTGEEIKSLAAEGMDIQLHSHRHRLPTDRQHAVKELTENKAILEPLVGKELHHFCYPSGVWSHEVWPLLAGAGITSGVTCDIGLNYPNTATLALNRFLDGEHIAQIEFDAELSGYMELFRRLRCGIKSMMIGRGNNRRGWT